MKTKPKRIKTGATNHAQKSCKRYLVFFFSLPYRFSFLIFDRYAFLRFMRQCDRFFPKYIIENENFLFTCNVILNHRPVTLNQPSQIVRIMRVKLIHCNFNKSMVCHFFSLFMELNLFLIDLLIAICN